MKPDLPRIPCHALPHSPHKGSARPRQTTPAAKPQISSTLASKREEEKPPFCSRVANFNPRQEVCRCLSALRRGRDALSHTRKLPCQCLKAVFIFLSLAKTKPLISNPNPLLLLLITYPSLMRWRDGGRRAGEGQSFSYRCAADPPLLAQRGAKERLINAIINTALLIPLMMNQDQIPSSEAPPPAL